MMVRDTVASAGKVGVAAKVKESGKEKVEESGEEKEKERKGSARGDGEGKKSFQSIVAEKMDLPGSLAKAQETASTTTVSSLRETLSTATSSILSSLALPAALLQTAATKHAAYASRTITATKETLGDEFFSRWRRSAGNVWERKEKTAEDVRSVAKRIVDMGPSFK